ncbi:hypothetical protein AC480_04875 [miscellaneous Crenarchaeota group archaeon SMTZ1-55]|nr:MAG: hypothetical protein AC480_04875 [miscellaneous Crenarchaeota group archaeon SMTZ1-55]
MVGEGQGREGRTVEEQLPPRLIRARRGARYHVIAMKGIRSAKRGYLAEYMPSPIARIDPQIPSYIRDIKRFECQKCAECCKNTRILVTYSDIKRWTREGRWDILRQVSLVERPEGTTDFCFYTTVSKGSQCPFLSHDNLCLIQHTKPKVCKHFPFNASKEKLALCKGTGMGEQVAPNLFTRIYASERRDFRDLICHAQQVMTVLLASRVVARILEQEG